MVVEMSETNKDVRIRNPSNYEDLSGRFRLLIRSYDKQFASIYTVRIIEARRKLEKIVPKKWGKPAQTLMSLNNVKGEPCVIIGTLYKHQELKPSVLQEVSKQYQTVPPPARTHFVSDKDELILEDETQRVVLHGKMNVHEVVTGCVVAVYGKLMNNGVFEVEDFCWPEVEPCTKNLPPPVQDKFLIVIGGMELAINTKSLSLQLLIDWVCGWIGLNELIFDPSKIVHALIAGNCIRSKAQTKPKYGAIIDNAEDIEAVKELDYIISQLLGSIDVDIMPGEFDPTTHTLPQQPLHKCLFPQSAAFPTFHTVSNPHAFRVENRLVVGTSGQPVEDIQRYSSLTDPLDILERTLEWGHLAPTAPDTLACYPFSDRDPFLLKERPHIYFVGNQAKFQTKVKEYDNGKYSIASKSTIKNSHI